MLDVGSWMLDVGCWMLDVGCWMLDVGCWMLDVGVGCWMFDVRCSQGFMGRFPQCKTSRIEPLNRRKTSNTQHPTSNNQWFPIGPLIGGCYLRARDSRVCCRAWRAKAFEVAASS